jgi:alpha,alpha-trehalase
MVAAQEAGLFSDCKHFVDMPLRVAPEEMLENFEILKANGINKESLERFINRHFDEPGSDIEPVIPVDWREQPPAFIENLKNTEMMMWGSEVYNLWKTLSRQVTHDVRQHPDRHSVLCMPYPFIIAGDRFRETYYWDSYWIIKGLIACDMVTTAGNLVMNLIYMVDLFGFVPNGARTYYSNRSQPPLLSEMVKCVWEATRADDLLAHALPRLIKSYEGWTSGLKAVHVRGKDGKVYRMARYFADFFKPRPESYREDAELAEHLDPVAAAQLFCDIASAAESGWDFSSRWFADGESLSTIRTTKIVPADLNAWLYQMAVNISDFAGQLGQDDLCVQYKALAEEHLAAITELMWNAEDGCWHDLLLDSTVAHEHLSSSKAGADGTPAVREAEQLRDAYASNFVPLWCGCGSATAGNPHAVSKGLRASGLLQPAGIVTSLHRTSGQQWDYPNAWAPLQHMIIDGLARSGDAECATLAQSLALTWLNTNLYAYQFTGHMHEKYDAANPGGVGAGGEYIPQVGFGWTNGVALDLMRRYGGQMGAGKRRASYMVPA